MQNCSENSIIACAFIAQFNQTEIARKASRNIHCEDKSS